MILMDDLEPGGRRLADLNAALALELERLLDVDAGVRDVLAGDHNADLSRDLHDTLDVFAGLRAIVPVAGSDAAVEPPRRTSASRARAVRVHGEVAYQLMLDTAARLAVRHHPAVRALASVFVRASDLARVRAIIAPLSVVATLMRAGEELDPKDPQTALALTDELVERLAAKTAADRSRLGSLRDLSESIADLQAFARGRGGSPVPGARGTTVAQRAVALAEALVHDLKQDFERDLARAYDLMRQVARDGHGGIDDPGNGRRNLTLATGLYLDLARFRRGALAIAEADNLGRDLARARHDFTRASLRGFDLGQVSLDGLRWSAATIWPSDSWHDHALMHSTEIEPGVYEIHIGAANVPTHLA